MGDEDGVVVVSKEIIEEVFAKAEKKLAYEQNRLSEIAEYIRKRKEGNPERTIEPSWFKNKTENFEIVK
jgi:regulator of RNase E activity RraA